MPLPKQKQHSPPHAGGKKAGGKKGFLHFLRLLFRNFAGLIKLNMLYQLCILPCQLLYVICIYYIYSTWFYVFIAGAVLASILVGPACAALHYCLAKMLMEQPVYIAYGFFHSFKANFKTSCLPGMLYAALLAAQLLLALMFLQPQAALAFPVLAAFLFSALFVAMLAPHFFLQLPQLALGAGGALRNSLVLIFRQLPRSLAAALVSLSFAVLQLLLFLVAPAAALLLSLFFAYAIPGFVCAACIWGLLNSKLKIQAGIMHSWEAKLGETKIFHDE